MKYLLDHIRQNGFTYIVELEPPKHGDVSETINAIREVPADFFSVVDSHIGIPRMNPLGLCHPIHQIHNKPTILHFSCRDRNWIATEGDLLAAWSFGVKNVLALTGDRVHNTVNAKGVFETNSIGLVKFLHKMNREQGTNFQIGVATNPNIKNLDAELNKTRLKIEAGAQFIMTQPCFDIERIQKLVDAVDIPVIVGVFPLLTEKLAQKVNDTVPGIKIPMEIFKLEKKMPYYYDLIRQIKQTGAAGIDLMTFHYFERCRRLIKKTRKFPFANRHQQTANSRQQQEPVTESNKNLTLQ